MKPIILSGWECLACARENDFELLACAGCGAVAPHAGDIPTEEEIQQAEDWWRNNAPEEAKGLIDAEVVD